MATHRAAPRGPAGPKAAATRVGVLAALLLLVTVVLAATPAAAAAGTYVRLAQLTAGTAGVELVVASVADPRQSITIPGPGYGGLSDYRRVEAGDYVIGFRPAGSQELPAVGTTLDAMAGSAYTLAATDTTAGPRLRVVADDLTPPAAGQARVRVLNATAAPQLDVRGPAGEEIATGLLRGEVGDYGALPPGDLVLTVDTGGDRPVEVRVTTGANQVLSVVLLAAADMVAAQVHVDAGGPAAMPPGPVHAGFGGATPRPGGQASPVAFLVLAVASAGLSAHLARRARGSRPAPRTC